MKKRGRILRNRIFAMLLAAAVFFSYVDLTVLAMETDAQTMTETDDTGDSSAETPEETENDDENVGVEDETGTDDRQTTGDDDGGKGDAPGKDVSDKADEETGANDGTGESTGMEGESPDEDENRDNADEEKDPVEEKGEASVSENAVSVSENAVSVSENTVSVSENTIAVGENGLSIKAANSLGTLLLSELQIAAQEAGEEAADSYAVGEIEITGKTATVSLHAAGSCTAVVVIYEEGSEKPYAFGSAVVSDGENQVSVEIAADSLPTYFKAKGYLVETDTLRPLSGEYSTVMYTRAMQEFLAKTVDDFGDAPVINLDEDKNTNFLVLKEGNLLIKGAAGEGTEAAVNRLVSFDEASATYTFGNVDENVKGLEPDAIFLYQYGEIDYHIIKVKTIELQETDNGTAAVIVASKEELNAEEVFQHVRIDQVSGTAAVEEPTQANCPEGVTYLGREGGVVGYAIEGDPSLALAKDTWKLKREKGESSGLISGSLGADITAGFGATVKLAYYLDWSLFYVDVNFEVEASVKGTVSAEGEASIPLVTAPLEQADEEGLFIFTYTPKFVVGGKIEATVDLGMSGSFGVKLGVGELEEGTYGPYNNLKLDILQIDAQASVYLGIKFDPQLKVGDIFNANLDCGARVRIEAAAKNGMSVATGDGLERHECGIQCVAIGGHLDIPLDGELKILKWKEYDLSEMLDVGEKGNLLEIPFANCYYSIKHKEFGWGDCPHKEYLITCTVKDKYGRHTVAGASIETSQPTTYALEDQSINETRLSGAITDSQGNAVLWLPVGTHTLYVSKGGDTTPNMVTVDGAKKAMLRHDYVEEKIDSGALISVVLKKDGSLWVWGLNNLGQIGNGMTNSIQTTPYKVMEDVRDFSVGLHKIYAIKQDGSLWEWGLRPGNGAEMSAVPVHVMDGVKSIYSLGSMYSFSAAITEDGSLYTWGENEYGQIGNGTTDRQLTPVKVLDHVKEMELYYADCAAITEDGSLYMWGRNQYGKIGNGKRGGEQLTPIKILDQVKEVDNVNGLDRRAAAITEDGSLYMWGENSFGGIGNGESNNEQGKAWQLTPYKVMEKVKTAIMWNNTSASIKNDGSLYMWGESGKGLYFGIGQMDEYLRERPFKVMDGVENLQADVGNFFALKEDGGLYAWGSGGVRLGNGTGQAQYTPVKIMDGVADCIANKCIARKEDGSLYTWGDNQYGRVGNGTTQDQPTPYKVLENVKDYSCVDRTVFAVTTDGSLWAWGANDDGNVGCGSTDEFVATPTRITFPDDPQTLCDSAYSLSADHMDSDEAAQISMGGTSAALMAVHAAKPGSPAAFSGLMPNETYNFYAMKNRETETPLAPDNLLYIGQYTSDGGGNLTVSYEMREAYETPEVFVVGLTRIDLSAVQISIPDIIYNGSGQVVAAVVTYDGKTLTEGVDYEIYGTCLVTEPGEYQVVLKGIGDYCGAVEATFRVKKVEGGSDPVPGGPDDDPDPDRNDVLPEDIPENGVIPEGLWIAGLTGDGYPYTGSAIKPQIRVYDNKTLLKEKTDYTISYKNNKKVNDASVVKTAPTITVTGKGNYSGKDTVVFKILPLDIGGEMFDADDLTLACNGKILKPIPTLWWESKKLKNKTEYTVAYYSEGGSKLDGCKEAGNYEIELTGVGNFTGTRRIALRMTDQLKLMSKMKVTKIPNQTYLSYNGNPVTPAVTVKEGKTELTEGTHYTVSYSNNTKIGTGYAIVKGLEAGGYSGTKRVSFKITGVSIRRAVVSGLRGQTFVYDGMDRKPALQLALQMGGETKTLTEGDDYSVSWQKNRNAGTATVIFTGNQQKGYIGTVKKTFQIKAFNIAQNAGGCFAAKLTDQTAPYAKGGSKPTVQVTFRKADGTVETLREKTDYTLSYQNNKAVNDGSDPRKQPAVTIKGKGNFTGTFAQKLTYTIVKQDIGRLSVTAADKTYQNKKNVYDTKIVVTDLNGKVLKAGTDYEKKVVYTYKELTQLDSGTTRQAGEEVNKIDVIPAGTVLEVCVSGKENYTGSMKGEYRITKASISAASVSIPTQIYTGKRVAPGKDVIVVKVNRKPVDPSQYEIVSYQNNIKKGTASVTIRGVDNYGGTKKVKFKIRAKGFLWWGK